MNRQFEYNFFKYLKQVERNILLRPLNLGGVTSVSGGGGSPPGGFIGVLPQTRVAYDLSEDATDFTPMSGASLLDNLNHIRYRISNIETTISGGMPGEISIYEDNILIASGVTVINFEGNVNVANNIPGGVTVTISGSSTDEKVKVSQNDTTADYLGNKIIAGTGIVITELNNGSNENIQIATQGVSMDGHTHTPSQVGLENVTNDAQLTRGDGDFYSFGYDVVGPRTVLLGERHPYYTKNTVWVADIEWAAKHHPEYSDEQFKNVALFLFDGSEVIGSAYLNWAGTPFSTPPTITYLAGTWLEIRGFDNNQRSFLYSGISCKRCIVTFDTSEYGFYTGYRADDGTDNNYIEFVIFRQTTGDRIRFYSRQRTGGGTVTETEFTHLAMPLLPHGTTLRVTFNGTLWSSWSAQFDVVCGSITEAGNSTTSSWTPTRFGWVTQFKTSTASRAYIDDLGY